MAIDSRGALRSALTTIHTITRAKISGTSGYPGTRYGRGSCGRLWRNTTTASATGIQKSAYDITAMLVS